MIYYMHRDGASNTSQTAPWGRSFTEDLTPGVVYEFAVWCGPQSAVTDLFGSSIPSDAWIRLYVTRGGQIVVLSSGSVNVHVR